MSRKVNFADLDEQIQNLLRCSVDASKSSYSPYSRFPVGAAVLCDDGSVYNGCNVENVSYGLGICAEQTAIVKAVSDGKRRFKAIAVTADAEEITPCGRCRQCIVEFGRDIIVYCSRPTLDRVLVASSSDLLPLGFKM